MVFLKNEKCFPLFKLFIKRLVFFWNTSQNKEMNVSVKDAYQMTLLEPEKQNSAIASMPKSEVAKAVPDDVTFAPIEQMESADLHNFYNCKH